MGDGLDVWDDRRGEVLENQRVYTGISCPGSDELRRYSHMCRSQAHQLRLVPDADDAGLSGPRSAVAVGVGGIERLGKVVVLMEQAQLGGVLALLSARRHATMKRAHMQNEDRACNCRAVLRASESAARGE